MPRRPAPSVDERHQRARERTARWRARQRNGAMVLPLELDSEMLDLLERLERLPDIQLTDRQAVAAAVQRLFTRSLAALVRQEARNCR